MLKKIEKILLKDDNEYISSVIIEVVKENLDSKLICKYTIYICIYYSI